MKLLITRPEPGASATMARLQAAGFESLLAPCLTIIAKFAKLPARPAAIIITSTQAVPALPEAYQDIPVFCVGDATAGRLREAGFGSVESASGDARDLFRLITLRCRSGTHLLVTGQGHGLELTAQLRAAGIKMLRRTVYAAHPVRSLPTPVRAALAANEIHGVLFYSAETARAFIRLNPPGTRHIIAFALSPAVADALHGLPWAAIRVALAPTEADLLALLA